MAGTNVDPKIPEMIEAVSGLQLMRIMECPVCQEIPFPPIFQCTAGHSICKICKPKLKVCPQCRAGFSIGRNYVAEEIVLASKHECPFKYEGCIFQTTGDLMEAHIMSCPHRPFDCPRNGCDSCSVRSLTLTQATEHLLNFHKGLIVKGPIGVIERTIDFEYFSQKYSLKPDLNWPTVDFQFDGRHFFAEVFTINDTINWSVLLIGSEEEACKYRVKIVSQPGMDREVQWTVPVWSVLKGKKLKDPTLTARRFLPSCTMADFKHLAQQPDKTSPHRFCTSYEIIKSE